MIAPGTAVVPPLPRKLFWPSSGTEQALVNVRGVGLALVAGCGQPPIERILGVTERVLDVRVHAARTARVPQAVLGNRYPRGGPSASGTSPKSRDPRMIALSGHESTPWTYDASTDRFGHGYRILRVGEEPTINANNVSRTSADAS
ncbi:MAG: hypothetical protein J2P17_31810 [Mycobacterium sp.]|nr:hypothetical protein [Mycobacterium sp.]